MLPENTARVPLTDSVDSIQGVASLLTRSSRLKHAPLLLLHAGADPAAAHVPSDEFEAVWRAFLTDPQQVRAGREGAMEEREGEGAREEVRGREEGVGG